MIVQVAREQAPNSSSSLVLATQSPSTAPASPRDGCAHGRRPCAVRVPADAPSPGTLSLAASAQAGLRLPSPSYMAWRFVNWTCAFSLVALMAMSVRTLFTSHARCWSVGSLPYLAKVSCKIKCTNVSPVPGLPFGGLRVCNQVGYSRQCLRLLAIPTGNETMSFQWPRSA